MCAEKLSLVEWFAKVSLFLTRLVECIKDAHALRHSCFRFHLGRRSTSHTTCTHKHDAFTHPVSVSHKCPNSSPNGSGCNIVVGLLCALVSLSLSLLLFLLFFCGSLVIRVHTNQCLSSKHCSSQVWCPVAICSHMLHGTNKLTRASYARTCVCWRIRANAQFVITLCGSGRALSTKQPVHIKDCVSARLRPNVAYIYIYIVCIWYMQCTDTPRRMCCEPRGVCVCAALPARSSGFVSGY